nr:hypothetical protein StreXyl84_79990 [Streptomyces sp. Xyl84]
MCRCSTNGPSSPALSSTVATHGRAYDAARHQQAAMLEQLLEPEAADIERDDQEP